MFQKTLHIIKLHTYYTFTYIMYSYIPGQHLLLQEMLVMFIPEHSLPPQLGLGWVHVRCRVITPSPQVVEQFVTFCQSLHPPSTI